MHTRALKLWCYETGNASDGEAVLAIHVYIDYSSPWVLGSTFWNFVYCSPSC